MDMLTVEHLSVRFGATEVLRDLNFRLEQGATLAVIGPNGAGKTVLFRVLIGALAASGGSYRWAAGARIGYVPQKLDLDRDVPITAADFLRARAATPAAVNAALEQVGMEPALGRRALGALSGGQFQRLLVAFALLGEPTVLMLDEPTAGVDEPGQKLLIELIAQLRAAHGMTVLFISHELSVVYAHADHVLCLGHGGACYGEPRAVLNPEQMERMYGTGVDYHDPGHHQGLQHGH